MPQESVKKLYDTFSSKYDIGDFSTFQTKMQAPESRKKFFDFMNGQGYDLGDFSTFETKVSTAPTGLGDAIASPFKKFAEGAKELFVDKGDTPLVPLRDTVAQATASEKMPLLGAYGGVLRGVAGLVESFTTPKNLAIAVGTSGLGALPLIGKVGLPAVEAFFAYEAANQVPDLWRVYQKAPLADKPELMTQIIGSIGITGLAGAGAAKKVKALGKEAAKKVPSADLGPLFPEQATPRGETLPEIKGKSELRTAAKTAQEIGTQAETIKTQEALAESKRRFKEELSTPELQLEALAEELAGKPLADLSVKQKAELNRKAVGEYRKRLAQNAEVIAFKQGKTLKDIPTEERGPIYEQAREEIRQELISGRAKPVETTPQDIGALAQSLEGVTGPTPRSVALPELEQAGQVAAEIQAATKPIQTEVAAQPGLSERRRLAAEKRQQLAEERLKLQEQKLETQRQKAIEQLAKKYTVKPLKAKGAAKAQNGRPSERYEQGRETVETLIKQYKEQAIPKSEWSGLAKAELEKQGYPSRIISELTEPKRGSLEQAPGYETSRPGRVEKAVEPPPELKTQIDAIAETSRPNQIAQADYERARQDVLEELQKDPNLRVYFDSGNGIYKVEVLQREKLTPEAAQAVQALRKQAALEGGYSLETVGRGFEVAATPEAYYEGKPLAGASLPEKISELVERKKVADTTFENFVKAKRSAEAGLVDRYLTEEAPAPLIGKTKTGENVEIVTRRNRSAIEPDAPEWLEQIKQAKRAGAKEAGDPYIAIYEVTQKTAERAAKQGFTFLRKNLSEADNARLDAVIQNMTEAGKKLSANPFFDVKLGLEAYKNLTEIGYLTLKASGRALLTKAEWASRMLSEIGESARPYLDDIWESIQKGWRPGAELEMPKAFAERAPKAVEAKATLAKEEPPATSGDKLNEWARNVKLASTSSLLRSFAGNLTMQMLKTPKRAIAAGANRALAAVTGAKRDRFGQEAATELYGTLRSLKQGVEEAKQVIRENPEALKNSLFLSQETGRSSGSIGVGLPEGARFKELREKLGRGIRMPQKLQGAIDALSRVPSGQGLIDMLAVRQAFKEGLQGEAWVNRVEQLQNETRAGNTEIGKQLLAEAKTEAAEMTFQAELGKIAQKVNAVRDVPGVRFLVPFFNTWVNLWKQGIRHTPLNVLRPTFIRSIQKAFDKNPELRSIGSLSDEIAAMTTGTAFTLTTFGALTKLLEGDIIGYGPEDQKERQRLFASGWKPYSLKLGNNYVSFKGFEPVSTWLTMMADANEGRKKEGALGAFDGVSANVVRNFIENPFLTGITETMDALRGGAKPEEFLAGMALGATIPTFLQQTARVVDPKYRQTPKDAEALEKFAAEYTKRVPFLSRTLQSELDVFGKEKTVDSPALRYLAVNISKQDRGVVQDELRRLNVGIGFPRDTYKGLELTEPQMRELLVLAGGRMEKALAKMVVSPGYKQLRDEEKKNAINYVVNKVREDSKEFLFKHLATKKAQPKNRGSAVAKPFAR